MKSVSHIILATLLSTGTALAQDTIDFDSHDSNNDGFLTNQEWNEIDAVVVAFADVDVDGDGKLSKAEVTAASEVDAESSPQPGADLAAEEVTAEEHSMAQRGQIDRNADEEDPTVQSTAAGAGESDASMTTADAVSGDAAADQDDSTISGTSGMQTQGALDVEPADVTADEDSSVDASGEQTDVGVRKVDADSEDDAVITAASDESGNEASTSSAGMSDSSSMQASSNPQSSAQDGMQQAGSQSSSTDAGHQAFNDADADGDKRLSQREVEDAGFDYVVMYFEPLDTNRDSYLDESEWDQGNAGQQAAPGLRDQQDASLYLDGNDTSNGENSGSQTTHFERSAYEGDDGATRFEDDFDTYDINDDGYLDESEAVDTDWVDVNLFENSDVNDDGLIDIGEANDGFMEWGDDEAEEEPVTGEDY